MITARMAHNVWGGIGYAIEVRFVITARVDRCVSLCAEVRVRGNLRVRSRGRFRLRVRPRLEEGGRG